MAASFLVLAFVWVRVAIDSWDRHAWRSPQCPSIVGVVECDLAATYWVKVPDAGLKYHPECTVLGAFEKLDTVRP